MEFYFVVLFFHISSAFVLFMGMSLEWVGINKLSSSSNTEQAGDWVNFLSSLKFAYMSAGILLLVTGIYLAAAKWGWTPWIIVSFLLWVFIVIQGSVFTGRKIGKVGKLVTSNSNMAETELRSNVSSLKLMGLLQSRLAVGLGAVFIMTVKPDLVGAIVVVIVAIILAVVPMFSKSKADAVKTA